MFIGRPFTKLYEVRMNSNMLLARLHIYLKIIAQEELFLLEKSFSSGLERKTERLYDSVMRFILKQGLTRN